MIFFVSVGKKMADKMDYDINWYKNVDYHVDEACPPTEISLESVEKLVDGIITNKSSGIKGINTKILKDAPEVLTTQLHCIFNNSVSQGIFLDAWIISNVVPIPKSGYSSVIGNWHPISLLLVPGRLLEKVVYEHVMNR